MNNLSLLQVSSQEEEDMIAKAIQLSLNDAPKGNGVKAGVSLLLYSYQAPSSSIIYSLYVISTV